jgi:hypothetical protein
MILTLTALALVHPLVAALLATIPILGIGMVPILRVRAARRGEPGFGTLYGLTAEKSLADFDKSEIVARLRPIIERGELPPQVLSQVDAGLPISVLSLLGYSDEAIAKSEAAALRQISGGLLEKGASVRLMRQEELAPARRPGRPVQVDEPELERLRAELERLRKIERVVKRFIDASGGPRQVHPSLQDLDDD